MRNFRFLLIPSKVIKVWEPPTWVIFGRRPLLYNGLLIAFPWWPTNLTKMYWLLGRKSDLSTSNKLLIYKILKPVWLTEYNYGVWLPLLTSHAPLEPCEKCATTPSTTSGLHQAQATSTGTWPARNRQIWFCRHGAQRYCSLSWEFLVLRTTHRAQKTTTVGIPAANILSRSLSCSGCRFFSKIDLVRVYNQIPGHSSDIQKTAVTTIRVSLYVLRPAQRCPDVSALHSFSWMISSFSSDSSRSTSNIYGFCSTVFRRTEY
jgi:hypothetical protein